jgi:hypothetical protein
MAEEDGETKGHETVRGKNVGERLILLDQFRHSLRLTSCSSFENVQLNSSGE